MLNIERNIDKLVGVMQDSNDCSDFLKLAGEQCSKVSCDECKKILKEWLLSKCKEPEFDWSKIKKDTKILVWNGIGRHKHLSYFKGVSTEGKIQAYKNGTTSWSSQGKYDEWDFAELVEE